MDAIILVLLRSFGIVFGIAIVIAVASLVIICIDVDKKEKEAKRDKEIQQKKPAPNCPKEFVCPRCGSKVYSGEARCANCGQELDWTIKTDDCRY